MEDSGSGGSRAGGHGRPEGGRPSMARSMFVGNAKSFDPQVSDDGNFVSFRSDATDLVLLHVDEEQLTSPLVYEQLPGMPEVFPHVYGPINLAAVVRTEQLRQ